MTSISIGMVSLLEGIVQGNDAIPSESTEVDCTSTPSAMNRTSV